MKKSLGMILGLGLLCSSAVAAEEAQAQDGVKVEESKKSSIGWFVGAGMGMVNTSETGFQMQMLGGNVKMPMFGVSLSGGVILPHNENVNHLISADLVYQTFANIDKRLYELYTNNAGESNVPYPPTAKSNGYGIEATINYNLSYDIYKSDTYTFAMLGGVGIGGAYSEWKGENGAQMIGGFDNRSSFIINANLGVRNILFKNHAIDLTLKSRVLEVYSIDTINKQTKASEKRTIANTNAGFTLMLSYTFLKF